MLNKIHILSSSRVALLTTVTHIRPEFINPNKNYPATLILTRMTRTPRGQSGGSDVLHAAFHLLTHDNAKEEYVHKGTNWSLKKTLALPEQKLPSN